MLLRRSLFVTVALAVALLLGPAATQRSKAEAAPITPAFGPAIDPLASYVGQVTCDPTPKPGAVALMNLLEATYPSTTSFGIGRDCAVGGTSEHKEGRAYDWGVDAADPAQAAMAEDLLIWLLAPDAYGNKYAMARRLGIMYVIWNRMTWKAYAADKGWQPYTGASPHTDHVHFSLSWDGALGATSWLAGVPKAAPAPGKGYWLPTDLGLTFAYGAPNYGSLRTRPVLPVVGMAPTPTGKGYWHAATDGGIFAFGDATFLGSTGGIPLNKPIVGMASTPSGKGYWLVASDGGIFAYGDAAFRGSTGGIKLNKPIVGMAPTPSGLGYWLVASDGGIFAYGDAVFRGSTGGVVLNRPIVGMTPTKTGAGYWLVASDGGIFAYGDATFRGSTGGTPLVSPIRAMVATGTGAGYWMVASDGGVFNFGDAPFQGSAASSGTTIVGIARYL
jgi:hypothetical protein